MSPPSVPHHGTAMWGTAGQGVNSRLACHSLVLSNCCCFALPLPAAPPTPPPPLPPAAVFDVFAHLGATDDQLDFPVLYASARQVCGVGCCGEKIVSL